MKEEEAWNFIRPVCRELDELVNLRKVKSYLAFIVNEKVNIRFILSAAKFIFHQEEFLIQLEILNIKIINSE
ncbi:MAG TPA: hypothetical protein VK882_05805 [Nitrososphaeraceae archaeon]|nr:hypothetical protein [Nitrososphaeraceae archaeon]